LPGKFEPKENMKPKEIVTSATPLEGIDKNRLESQHATANVQIKKSLKTDIVKGAKIVVGVKIEQKHNKLLNALPVISNDIVDFFNEEIKQATPSYISNKLNAANIEHRKVNPLNKEGDEWHGKTYTVVWVKVKEKGLDGIERETEKPRGFGGQPRWSNKEVKALINLIKTIVQADKLGLDGVKMVALAKKNGMSFTDCDITRNNFTLRGSRPSAVAKAQAKQKAEEQDVKKQEEADMAMKADKAAAEKVAEPIAA